MFNALIFCSAWVKWQQCHKWQSHSHCASFSGTQVYSTIYWKWLIISNEWCPFYYSMIQQSNFITQSVNKTNVLQKSNSDGLMSQWYLWTLQSYNPNAFAPQISWNSLTFSAVVVLVPRRQSGYMQTANELVIPLWMHKVSYKTQSSNFSTAFLFVRVCLSSKFIFLCVCLFLWLLYHRLLFSDPLFGDTFLFHFSLSAAIAAAFLSPDYWSHVQLSPLNFDKLTCSAVFIPTVFYKISETPTPRLKPK